jgi:hypothetical protein
MEPHEPKNQGGDYTEGAGNGEDHDPVGEGNHGWDQAPWIGLLSPRRMQWLTVQS